ncbi:protein trichome birefringence-like 25 [Sesamum angolense]|uniref:Protein trichome birefringence-like 25 n=1 Tax=Sesamum angolense TaxID=2727404 RepID=A0AAE2C738_9LAMI|nr:protein trichome birefringence-like 25 [Sesamum angolense]
MVSESDVRSNVSSSSRAERRRVLLDRAENSRSSLTSKQEKWAVEADLIQDKNSDEFHRAQIAQGLGDSVIYHENENRVGRSGRDVDRRNGEKGETESFWRAQRMDAEVISHTEEGPSRSSYDHENPARNRKDVDGLNNVDYIGEDQAELLKKLDELKDQLSRSGNLIDKGKEKLPIDRRMLTRILILRIGKKLGAMDFIFRDMPSHLQGYGDPSRSHMHRSGPHQTPAPYQIPSSHAYMSGPYMDDGMAYMETMEPYPPNFSRHHPSCSCHQCRNKRQVPTPALPSAYSDKYSDVPNDRTFNYHNNPGPFGTREFDHSISNPPPLRSHSAKSQARWSSDVSSEADRFIRRRPPRVHLPSGGKHCRPIAGGAPFLTCYNCFELLLLPKKVLSKKKSRKKMRCEACSTVIVFTVSDKKLVISIDVEVEDNPVEVDNKHNVLSTHVDGHLNQTRTTFSSDDYDNSGYDFHSMDRETRQMSPEHQGRANKSTEIKSRNSLSTYTSEAEEDRESLRSRRKDSSSIDLSTKDKGPPPPAGSSLQDYFEYSNKYHAVNRPGEGNRREPSEHDRLLPNKTTTRQISRKQSSATEIDLSSNEYFNTGTTFDSGEASREGDRLRVSRAADSFYTKKSSKDSNRSTEPSEQDKANVTVNGHLIPDRLIKKAEKLAGLIHPGNYWYDFRAGFWGAMGGPCLGIIPPFIEEFNYPMPEHCGGGNTHIFVNGRELNQKDLNLLGSRGLPTERDKSYIIEISGRVLDEDTGEELQSLGKLAPTCSDADPLCIPKSVALFKAKTRYDPETGVSDEKRMKQFNSNLQRKVFSSVLVKFAVCFLLLGVAYRLLSSSFVQFSPVVVSEEKPPALSVGNNLPPQITDDRSPNLHHHTSQNESCNLFEGEWVRDSNGPMYTNSTCYTIEAPQNCMKNGRPDWDYVYWRWKPSHCTLPKLHPTKFLEIMRDKSLAFVGDSIMRNHVQSLLCLLSQVEQAVEVYHDEPYKNRRWSFPSHHFTVSVIWAPFLTKAFTFEDDDGVSSGLIQLHLDKLDTVWTQQYENFDYVVIAGGKWFLKSAVYFENNTIVGCHNCHDKNITELGFEYAYRKALNSTLKFISETKHRPYIFFRTTTPDHFENGEWNTGGYCNRTGPFKEGEIGINIVDEIMRNVELEEFEWAAAEGLEMDELEIIRHNYAITVEADGHPGVYRQFHPYDGKDKEAKIQNDCLHWCLPGPIDSWNDLMMEMLLRHAR